MIFFALFNFIAIVKCITCGICTKYHENTITYTNAKHSTWVLHRFCCPSYFRGEDHVAVYRTEKSFSSNARALSVSSHDLYWENQNVLGTKADHERSFWKTEPCFWFGNSHWIIPANNFASAQPQVPYFSEMGHQNYKSKGRMLGSCSERSDISRVFHHPVVDWRTACCSRGRWCNSCSLR